MFLKRLMLINQVHHKSVIFLISYFLNKGFKFQPNVCNKCHDLLMMSLNLSDFVILNSKGSNCHCIITRISKSETIKLLQNSDLTERSGALKNETLTAILQR